MPKHLEKREGTARTNRRTKPTAEALEAEQNELERAAKGKAPATKSPLTTGVARKWPSKRALRREKVSKLAAKGHSQAAMAEQLNCSRSTIWSDLRALSEAWQISAIDSRRTWAMELCRRLEHVCDQALAGFRRSLKDRVTVTETTDPKGRVYRREQCTPQAGDPRYLMVLANASKVQGDILGLSGGAVQREGLGSPAPLVIREVIVGNREEAAKMVRFAQIQAERAEEQTVDGEVVSS